MSAIEQNKARIFELYQKVNLEKCSKEILQKFTSDPLLIDYFMTLHTYLPGFQLQVDEITAEGNRVIVRSHIRCYVNRGHKKRIPICFPLVIGYNFARRVITSHWIISDTEDFYKQWRHYQSSLAIS